MVRYAATALDGPKTAKARGAYLRVSFKNSHETAQAINGMKLTRALQYLENVQEKKEVVPMRRYAGSVGRSAQGTKAGTNPISYRSSLEKLKTEADEVKMN